MAHDRADRAVGARAAGTSGSRSRAPSASWMRGSSSRRARGAAARDRCLRQPGRVVGSEVLTFPHQDRIRKRRDTPGVVTGSHLDSVLDGGAYDGPLGVVSGAGRPRGAARRAASGRRARSGSSVFVEEEGSRFGLACLGSRLATGATTWEQARGLRDRDGVRLDDAMASPGLDDENPQPWLGSSVLRASSSCTSSRVGTWSTADARSVSRAGSGRTAATASTSPASRTTPARRGWRTAATRCSPMR